MAAAARRVSFERDLSELHVTTIHGLCNRFIAKHRHHSPLGNNYETLDELTQLLFIFEHFDRIVGAPENDRFLHRWKTKWTAIEGARNYFDKITKKLVEIVSVVDCLIHSFGPTPLLSDLHICPLPNKPCWILPTERIANDPPGRRKPFMTT
jgi:hypothetical protein